MRILMGMIFYPRGGSAQVVRYLSQALVDAGHDLHLVVGTLRDGNPEHAAASFYGDLDLTPVDYTDAWQGFNDGADPITGAWPVPMHPSYEDKPGVPDRQFYRVDETTMRQLQASWRKALERARTFSPDILHLHHLNHLHEAAAGLGVPAIAHLHGTELKMLESQAEPLPHTELWKAQLRRAADGMQHFFAISPDVQERGERVLGIPPAKISMLPNGVDTALFAPSPMSRQDKAAMLRQILVDEPRGWSEGGAPGTVGYDAEVIERIVDKPLLLFVGRFLGFKRVPMLMQAIREVNDRFAARGESPDYNLLVWGGMPGEWEDEHPHTAAVRLGLDNVFFCGWLPHAILARGLGLADLFVAPSYFEPFGQVFLEAMATGMPCIATRSGGPLTFVHDQGAEANGWLAEVDDVASLADTIYAAITDGPERQRRGQNALRLVQRDYAWSAIAERFVEVYGAVA